MKRCRFVLASAALLALSIAHAAPLGRLFHSPEERAALDAARGAAQLTSPVAPTAAQPPVAAKPPSSATQPKARTPKKTVTAQRQSVMTGFVERSSGRNTVWLDNQARQLHGGYGELDPLDVGKARRN